MRIILILIFIPIYSVCSAGWLPGTWLNDGKADSVNSNSGNQGSGTQVVIGGTSPAIGEAKAHKETQVNFDIDIVPYLLPDQPGDRQIVNDALILGTTYKFSDKIHLWAKYVKLKFPGKEFEGVESEWSHEHYVGGAGFRWSAGNNKEIQLNFGTSTSSVIETKSKQKIEDMENPFAFEFRYYWAFDNLQLGVVASILDINSKAQTEISYKKAGYKYVALTLQFGIPDF